MAVQRVIGIDKNNFGLKAADEYLKLCGWLEGNILRDGTFKLAFKSSGTIN